MIKVLVEKPVPRRVVTCHNCSSVLEYGNADLHKDYNINMNQTGYTYEPKCITCPVCGCEVSATWISRNV